MQVKELAHLAKLTAGKDKIRPCLIGPTGSGKTAMVYAAAEMLGMPVVTLLLQTMLPEDVLGLPQRAKNGVRWVHPEWAIRASKTPHIIFLDELDKPSRECVSAVLTLMRSLEMHGLQLHNETIIIAAMQPVDRDIWLASQTTQALAARMVFIPINQAESYTYVAKRRGAPWVADIAKHTEPITLPTLDIPSPRQLDDLIRLARAGVDAGLLAYGSAQGKTAEWLAAKLAETAGTIDPSEKIDIDSLPPEAVAAVLPRLATMDCVSDWERAIVRVFTELPPETVAATMRAQYDAVRSAGVWCGEATEEEIAEAIKRATRAIAKIYRSRARR